VKAPSGLTDREADDGSSSVVDWDPTTF
jgi:hypothetical protein